MTINGSPEARIDGYAIRSDDPEIVAEYAYHAIVSATEARVRSHYLFHAAALATADARGILLAGEAGLGKTTLTLALMELGYGFLSDDVAAVSRAEGRLDPYPKSIGVRRKEGESTEKLFIARPVIAPSCPVRFLFVMHDPDAPVESPFIYLAVDRAPEELLVALHALPGVRAVERVLGGKRPMVRVELSPRTYSHTRQFATVCQQHGVLLFQVIRDREMPPDFRRAPCLEPLSPAEAAWELLKHLRGGADSAMMAEVCSGSGAQLYVALAELVSGWACYRLAVGHLDQAVEQIVAVTS